MPKSRKNTESTPKQVVFYSYDPRKADKPAPSDREVRRERHMATMRPDALARKGQQEDGHDEFLAWYEEVNG